MPLSGECAIGTGDKKGLVQLSLELMKPVSLRLISGQFDAERWCYDSVKLSHLLFFLFLGGFAKDLVDIIIFRLLLLHTCFWNKILLCFCLHRVRTSFSCFLICVCKTIRAWPCWIYPLLLWVGRKARGTGKARSCGDILHPPATWERCQPL